MGFWAIVPGSYAGHFCRHHRGAGGTGIFSRISWSEVTRHLVLTGGELLDCLSYNGELLLHRLSDRGDIRL